MPEQHLAVQLSNQLGLLRRQWRSICADVIRRSIVDFVLRFVVLILLIATTAVVAVSNISATRSDSAAQPSIVIVADSKIGSFRVTMRLADARRIFGPPSSQRTIRGLIKPCQVTWLKFSLVMTFAGGCSGNSIFITAGMSGSRWSTSRGLRGGDPLSRLRDLYPDATRQSRRGSKATWVIFRRGDHPGLVALVDKGRVTSFEINLVELSAP